MNSCRPLMCFSSYLELNKPNHLVLLEYIKVYETIKDKNSELDYLHQEKNEVKSFLTQAERQKELSRQSEVDQAYATVAFIENNETDLRNSIDEAEVMLNELYETNISSFQECFKEFNDLVIRVPPTHVVNNTASSRGNDLMRK